MSQWNPWIQTDELMVPSGVMSGVGNASKSLISKDENKSELEILREKRLVSTKNKQN